MRTITTLIAAAAAAGFVLIGSGTATATIAGVLTKTSGPASEFTTTRPAHCLPPFCGR
jgi:hypothetical protein